MMKNYLFILLLVFTFFCLSAGMVSAAGTIDINTASLGQLDELTGIGPALGQRIIDARPFSSVDDLLKVKGIGPATLQKIKDQGLAYVTRGLNTEPIKAANEPIEEMIFQDGVAINEVMPNPQGADETEEWIVTTIIQNLSVCS